MSRVLKHKLRTFHRCAECQQWHPMTSQDRPGRMPIHDVEGERCEGSWKAPGETHQEVATEGRQLALFWKGNVLSFKRERAR